MQIIRNFKPSYFWKVCVLPRFLHVVGVYPLTSGGVIVVFEDSADNEVDESAIVDFLSSLPASDSN